MSQIPILTLLTVLPLLGAAIALNLLFHIPMVIGVVLTALDTIMVL